MVSTSVSNSPSKWVVLPHYAFAACSFLALGILLLFSSDAFGGHYLHPKLLTLTHVAMLGWATMVIFGALYQLLPVVLEGKLYSQKLAYFAFGFLAVGTVLLAYCFWNFQLDYVLHLAGCSLFASFALFAINVIQTARHSPKWAIEADFIVTSAMWLLLTGFLGLLMAINFTHPFLPKDHVLYLQVHAHMGMAGWFLLLIIGVGAKLIPMFLLAHVPGTRKLNAAYYLVNGGLVLFTLDHLVLQTEYLWVYAALVVSGLFMFVWFLNDARRQRQRKDLDVGMKQTAVAVGFLVLPMVLVFLVSANLGLPSNLLSSIYPVYGMSIFLGFVSALILGQTFKTLPFIVWMLAYENHVGRYRTPLPKDLYNHRLVQWQNIFYLKGYLILIAGILLQNQGLILGGSLVFCLSAVLYTINVFQMLLHKVQELKPFTYGTANA